LKKPANVQPNDWRFTAVDLFVGTAVSPNSGLTFLNYFNVLAKNDIPDEMVTFERQGYKKGPSPWTWENNDKPLCAVSLVTGNIDESPADLHVEFANAFVGGGVMTGDAAMEETLFLVKPELMVAMALENRMVDEEAICIAGAKTYSKTTGYGQSFTFGGDYDGKRPGPPGRVAAIDAVRGGGPAMTEPAMLRDMNKARIAFEGATEVATGHWGCGAFGNNHDLMFLKQWLAASEAGVRKMYYYDFDKKQSHHIFPLSRKMGHLTVGQAWAFLQQITHDLRQPHNMNAFCTRIADISTGKLKVPGGK
jgi:poly(ADP-ribose) glycohydrolase